MKVLIVFNHPAPYKVNFFNEIAKTIDLTVIFERSAAKDRNKKFYSVEPNFKTIFTGGINIGNENNLSTKIIKHLKENKYDLVIMNGYSTLSEMLTINYLKRSRTPYVFYVNGGIINPNELKLKKNLKTYFISGAKAYFSPDKNTNDYLEYYGAEANKIINYPYSTIFEKDILTEKLDKIEERRKLNLPTDKPIIVSCGQFIERKNYYTLIKQWKNIKEYHLLLIGGGKQKKLYEKYITENHIDNITLMDFLPKEKLFNMFKLSDVFVFPSKEDIYGHVINEAMSQGLPCLSSNNVNAAFNLITDGHNGYIYDVNDENDLKEKLAKTLSSLEEFSKNAVETSKNYTIEKMGSFHIDAFQNLIKKPNIIYLTNAMDEEGFNALCKRCEVSPNPSNQNFHLRMLNAFATQYNTRALSLRPLSKSMGKNIKSLHATYDYDQAVKFVYPEVKSNIIDRYLFLDRRIYQSLDKLYKSKDNIVVVDTLNTHLLKVALKLRKKYKTTIIGVVTDNPNNLSGVKKSYIKKIMKLATDLDGYISLTYELNIVFNRNYRPNLVIEGVMEPFKERERVQNYPYIFFGGALYERYGVMDLVNAFIEANHYDCDLVVAGHGPLASKISEIARIKRNVKYVGQVNKETMLAYEQHAIACFNPRREDKVLENESIPSKVIEYVSSKARIVSTHNNKLESIFDNTITWTDSKDFKDLINHVIETKDNKKEKEKAQKAYDIAIKKFGYEVVGEKISQFFDNFLSSSSIK